MALLVDVFGYLSIVVHGLAILAQSVSLGGVLFLVLLARPVGCGTRVVRLTAAIAGWAAIGLAAAGALGVGMQAAVLMDTLDLPLSGVIGAGFAVAGLMQAGAALLLAALLLVPVAPLAPLLLGLGAVVLASALATTHAAARLTHEPALLAASALHMLGAAIWVGGIPCFLMALATEPGADGRRRIAEQFSRMSMVGVACIVVSAAVFSVLYIGSPAAAYGTAYGVMVGAKAAMFAALLALGMGNHLIVRRLRHRPAAPVLRMRRFAEVEIGIGFSIFFAAASLTAAPPAIDVVHDRVTMAEIIDRSIPRLPRLVSPAHASLAAPMVEPGSGAVADRNADDVAWSEYNHHWAGVFVAVMGLLALLNRAGLRWARHWPLSLLGMAVFLFFRADPEVWPMGAIGFWTSLRDVEVLQHRAFVALIVAFAVFEWGVRTGRMRDKRLALVFPLLTALGGALLLTHSHAVANAREQLLIELSHTPLALAGIAAGWARWLEIRADPPVRRWAGWVWPPCFVLVGALLLLYREA